ncbi:MAG: TraB/GumN family protein [Kofleriaceae bacterium]
MRLAWVVLLIVAACSVAPESPSKSERQQFVAAACPQVTNSFFYTLTKDGKTSYLFGTRHVSVGLDKFPRNVHAAWEAASVLVVESDTLDVAGPATAPPSIEAALGGDDYAKYRKLVGTQIADEQNARGVANGIVSIITLYDDFDQQLDTELQRSAKEMKREIVYLETAKETGALAANDTLLGAERLRKLLAMTKNRRMIRESIRHSLSLYCAGEWESGTLEFLAAPIVKGRNERWIERLDALATERGGVFIAVGANHVIGPEGLIDMFQKRGFELARNPEPTPAPSTTAGSAN